MESMAGTDRDGIAFAATDANRFKFEGTDGVRDNVLLCDPLQCSNFERSCFERHLCTTYLYQNSVK